MDADLRNLVRQRAENRCEYCRIHQDQDPLYVLHVEHIIAKQHGGLDDPSNLALACYQCNLHKGTNLSGIDPVTGQVVMLFHPRKEVWEQHFSLQGGDIIGLTPVGRATARLLQMNDANRRKLRHETGRTSHGENGGGEHD